MVSAKEIQNQHSEDNLEALQGGGEQVPVFDTEEVPTMEVPIKVGKQVTAPKEAEQVPTMEVPTEVGNATLKDLKVGEERSVDENRHAVRCQNRAIAYRMMVD